MKKSAIIFLILVIILSGCGQTSSIMNYRSEDYISLYDYSNLSVDYDYTQISEEDVTRIIEVEMSTNEAYIEITDRINVKPDDILLISAFDVEQYYFLENEKEAGSLDIALKSMSVGESRNLEVADGVFTDVTLVGIYRTASIDDLDFILDYYGYSSFYELEKFIRSRATDEIVFNYAYDLIWDNSAMLKIPPELEQQISLDITNYHEQITQQGISFEDYLSENDMTNEDFESSIISGYYDLMLYKAILDREGAKIDSKDIENYKIEMDNSEDFDNYDIYRLLAEAKVRDILTSKVKIV